ncbi:unnamed protein product [Phaedon cochleariae]|uniref:DUF4806 domain-containing protein n=1 Tax=Phaedon cochleariae TaxID=80249 RepID=A0A9N9SGA4_PHACE|nr:unnamed protein product [Phaedon cochleariae]
MKFLTTLEKHKELQDHIKVFKNEHATPDQVAFAGEKFFLALFGFKDTNYTNLDKYLYQCFVKSVTKRKFNLASLPPTSAAARQHSLRPYYQVQLWRGCPKVVEEWGWKKTQTGLTPITTLKDPASKALLAFFILACGCRKAGLRCSMICGVCNGKTCENISQVTLDESDEEDLHSLHDDSLSTAEEESDELKEINIDSGAEVTSFPVEYIEINEPGAAKDQIKGKLKPIHMSKRVQDDKLQFMKDNFPRVLSLLESIKYDTDCLMNSKNPTTANIQKAKFFDNLPLRSTEEITDFDMRISIDTSMKSKLATYLSQVGGNSAKDNIVRILRKMFDNKVAQECSWMGLRQNFKVGTLTMMSIIKVTKSSPQPKIKILKVEDLKNDDIVARIKLELSQQWSLSKSDSLPSAQKNSVLNHWLTKDVKTDPDEGKVKVQQAEITKVETDETSRISLKKKEKATLIELSTIESCKNVSNPNKHTLEKTSSSIKKQLAPEELKDSSPKAPTEETKPSTSTYSTKNLSLYADEKKNIKKPRAKRNIVSIERMKKFNELSPEQVQPKTKPKRACELTWDEIKKPVDKIRCIQCNELFRREIFLAHSKICKGRRPAKKFRCLLCSFTHVDIKVLGTHVQEEHHKAD